MTGFFVVHLQVDGGDGGISVQPAAELLGARQPVAFRKQGQVQVQVSLYRPFRIGSARDAIKESPGATF